LLQMVEIMGIPPAHLEQLFVQSYRITYGLIAALTVLFQGGLALYYRSRIGRLEAIQASTKAVSTRHATHIDQLPS